MNYKGFALVFLVAFLQLSCKKKNPFAADENKTPDPVTQEPIPDVATIRSWLTDKNATHETAALFYNLKQTAKTNTLFGHQDDTKRGVVAGGGVSWANEQHLPAVSTEKSDVKEVTGAYPVVYGHDFLHIANFTNNSWFENERNVARRLTIEAYNRGGVNTYCWHYINPVSQNGFYWSESPVEAVSKILPGGSSHEVFKASLAQVADFAKSLTGADGKLVPVIFRPFHEMDGSWFWWGKGNTTAENYKKLYQFTVDYLKGNLGVHNFIYAWSPDRNFTSLSQYLEFYPGDDYVDLVGSDNYEDMKVGVSPDVAAAKLKIVSDYAKQRNKLAAMTETGLINVSKNDWYTQQLLKSIKNQGLTLSYVLLWANTKDAFWTPYKGHASEQDFVNFKNDGFVLFSDKAPKMYKLE